MDPIKQLRRVAVIIVGTIALLAGTAMLVLPGPGSIVIYVGLVVLSTEFVWAAVLVKRIKERAAHASRVVMGRGEIYGNQPFRRRIRSVFSKPPESKATLN
ncbi:MAG: PGPGW domain-containing protein [Candidatus Hydrogenedentes bacterium]|nr:PGPGW domain-containing protein [Candidatus Hydrogenedentota bacterium]